MGGFYMKLSALDFMLTFPRQYIYVHPRVLQQFYISLVWVKEQSRKMNSHHWTLAQQVVGQLWSLLQVAPIPALLQACHAF